MSGVMIKKIGLMQLPKLRKQFVVAANSSFSYLPNSELRRVIRDNSLLHLGISWVHPKRILTGIWVDSKLMGYAIGSIEGSSSNLYWLYVDPSLRGKNLGLKLLTAFCQDVERKGAKRLNLSTHTHQDYYRRQGFKSVEKKMLHGVPMDIMCLTIHG